MIQTPIWEELSWKRQVRNVIIIIYSLEGEKKAKCNHVHEDADASIVAIAVQLNSRESYIQESM